jgi:hypothetical protein
LKVPIKGEVSFLSAEDGNRSSFQNVVFYGYLEIRTKNKVLKPCDCEGVSVFPVRLCIQNKGSQAQWRHYNIIEYNSHE